MCSSGARRHRWCRGGTGSTCHTLPRLAARATPDTIPSGSDAVHSCAQTTTQGDEGPWDNWGYDFTDDGLVSGGDFAVLLSAFGKTVDQGVIRQFRRG